ncbi:Protein AQP-3 [Aphelenchoides avenae]|nr:Protein AQP-3 [Aphelenchus avenae]
MLTQDSIELAVISSHSRLIAPDKKADGMVLTIYSRSERPPLYRFADFFGIDRNLAACTLCEFFCTFFLLYGGCSIVAVQVINLMKFDYGIAIGWGLWLIFTVYIGFNISGAHLNPAVSFLNYVMGQISFKRFVCYSIAQFLGSFLGAALTFVIYYEAINDFDGGVRQVYGPNQTASIFATYPQAYLSATGAMIDQILTTGILCINVLAITDERNKIPPQAQPPLLGLSLWFIVSAWSQNCGAALNPTRDLGPRLFSLCVGYGWETFSYHDYKYFWVPLIGPMIGAVLGGVVYKVFIGDYVPAVKNLSYTPKDSISTITPNALPEKRRESDNFSIPIDNYPL